MELSDSKARFNHDSISTLIAGTLETTASQPIFIGSDEPASLRSSVTGC